MAYYDHTKIEEKWLQFWNDEALFQQTEGDVDPTNKMYLLFAFAYPSGSGLHVGHVESKTALDILARYYRMNGKDVFFPVGWDAFGLPAENYAIKTGVHPAKTTKQAIDTFRRQIKRLGISYDWANELATSHPGYYKWTQWIFLQLFNKGLAYQKEAPVNWCPSCQTVLANEQVVEGACERCDTEVVQKNMKQWFFKITEYQDELISGLNQVDWPGPTKQQQLNWIGKKTGIDITYQVDGAADEIVCFTTRPDTNFGATFIVLAPEHPFVQKIVSGELASDQQSAVAAYVTAAGKKTELERQADGRKKSGAFTGFYATNQLTGKQMPIWISDFVLASFGTGAVVGVPGHDKRDFEFAQFVNDSQNEHEIAVERVVVASDGDTSTITTVEQVQESEGVMVNSEFLDGMEIHAAIEAMMDHLEKEGYGTRKTTYRLRDWLISRQRYWGAPIPIVYDPEGNAHPVKDEHLPWILPTDVDFKPTGESPLTSSEEFIERVEKLYGKGWRPEFDTMDTFVDSSWYFLRYTDSRNEHVFARPDQLQSLLPVDIYMIGPEHIVLHLLYSRFFTKFLRDEGYLSFDEPFMKMRHQGMILGPDGKKMSKSKGNVINPDEIIEKFGADTLRVYEMFMGPLEADKPWDASAVVGIYKFLQRVHRFVGAVCEAEEVGGNPSAAVKRKLHQTIQKVDRDIPALKFNTAIAALMECLNLIEKEMNTGVVIDRAVARSFVLLLAPLAPFLTEELYQQYFSKQKTIHIESWPVWDEALAQEEEVCVPVQINGKVRAQLLVAAAQIDNQQHVVGLAQADEKVAGYLAEKQIKKTIYVPGKILSFVV